MDDDGVVAILVALLAVVLFGLAAVVVDLGMARVVAADSQAVADAAALAGAAALYDGTDPNPRFDAAVAAVKVSGTNNGVDATSWDTCSAVLEGTWIPSSATSCIAFDSEASPRLIQVVTPSRLVAAGFGGVFGYSGSNVSRLAQAQARDVTIQDCSMCLSGRLTVKSGGQVSVKGDGSLVAQRGRADPPDARVTVTGNGSLAFAEFPPTPGRKNIVWSPEPVQAAPQEPFASLKPPDVTSLPMAADKSTTYPCDAKSEVDLSMAYQDLDIDGKCTVGPGILVVAGALHINPGASLTGTGTTIFLACSAGGKIADCTGSSPKGGGVFVLSAVLSSGLLDLRGGALGDSRRLGVACAPGNVQGSAVSGEMRLVDSSIDCTQSTWAVSGGVEINNGLASLGGLTVSTSGRVDLVATGLGSGGGPFRVALVK